jgi:hypothetical protein
MERERDSILVNNLSAKANMKTKHLLSIDYEGDHNLETSRRFLLLRLLAIVGILALLVNGITAFHKGDLILAVADLAMVPVFLALMVMALKRVHLQACSLFGTVALGVLTLFLAYLGGIEKSAVIWTLTFPLIALNLMGPKKGTIFSVCYLAVLVGFFLLGPAIAAPVTYSFFWSSRIVFSYTTVFLISLIAEKLRASIQSKLLNTGDKLERTIQEKEKLIAELTSTIREVKTLRGILPICAHCKRIRADQGYWQQVEHYISEKSEATFSHGLCPDCLAQHYPEHVKKPQKHAESTTP